MCLCRSLSVRVSLGVCTGCTVAGQRGTVGAPLGRGYGVKGERGSGDVSLYSTCLSVCLHLAGDGVAGMGDDIPPPTFPGPVNRAIMSKGLEHNTFPI